MGSLLKMLALFCAITLFGCNDDEGNDEIDNRSGEPYKFRIEISAEKPDLFYIGWGMGSYNYIDNGLPRTVWFTPDDLEKIPSPCIKDFEVPRNFTKIGVYASLVSIDIMSFEDTMAGIIIGKLYVNDKLLSEFSYKFGWSVGIAYNNNTEKFVVTNSLKETVELDKLD
jgi:hypothetical protein